VTYNPTGRPHPYRVRTTAIIATLVIGLAYAAAALFGPGNTQLPREVYQPSYPVKAPGWLEPTVTPEATP
jgi:hypothetical protein